METDTVIIQIDDENSLKMPESFMKKYKIKNDMEFCVSCKDDIVRGIIV